MAKKSSGARKSSGGRKTARKPTARKSTARKSSAKKSSAKRTRVSNRAGSFYAKRKSSGRFKEMDEQGRSQKVDRRKKAKKKAKSGYGDQGDRKR